MERPVINVTHRTQCNWLLRAGWMAQELLQSFGQDLASVTLVPGTGGIFQITVDDALIWDRKAQGGFPQAKALKQLVRDRVWPERDLGHADRKHGPSDGAPG